MKLRILMIAPEPFFTPRGTPFSILHRLKALGHLGHSVDLVTYPFGKDINIPGVRIFRATRPPGIRRVKIGPSLAKIPLDINVFRLARQLLHQNTYDLIHTHEEACLMGAWWHRKGYRHLYDMHSLLSQQMYNFRVPFARLAAFIWRRLENWAIHHSDAIIAICPELGEILKNMNVRQPWAVIENVGIAEFVESLNDNDVVQFRQNQGWDQQFVFGYIGTFEAYQGIPLLLEAIRRFLEKWEVPRIQWVLVGATKEERPIWSERIRSMNLENHVTLVERVDPLLAAYYQKAVDVLVSPRISGTNTPLKIYSYLASRTPILATRHPTHLQVLDDDVALLVNPDPDALATGMKKLLDHPDLRKQLATNARKRFERDYSYHAYLSKTAELLDTAFSPVSHTPFRSSAP